jgi:hypothetical protein
MSKTERKKKSNQKNNGEQNRASSFWYQEAVYMIIQVMS